MGLSESWIEEAHVHPAVTFSTPVESQQQRKDGLVTWDGEEPVQFPPLLQTSCDSLGKLLSQQEPFTLMEGSWGLLQCY